MVNRNVKKALNLRNMVSRNPVFCEFCKLFFFMSASFGVLIY